jgi:hypothetical protein
MQMARAGADIKSVFFIAPRSRQPFKRRERGRAMDQARRSFSENREAVLRLKSV